MWELDRPGSQDYLGRLDRDWFDRARQDIEYVRPCDRICIPFYFLPISIKIYYIQIKNFLIQLFISLDYTVGSQESGDGDSRLGVAKIVSLGSIFFAAKSE